MSIYFDVVRETMSEVSQLTQRSFHYELRSTATSRTTGLVSLS